MHIYLAGVAIVVAGGALSLLAPSRRRMAVTALGAALGGALQLYAAVRVLAGIDVPGVLLRLSPPLGAVRLHLDPLAAFFTAVFALGGIWGTLYGVGYLRPGPGAEPGPKAHGLFLSLLLASMSLLTVIQHAVAFFAVWEIMSLASFFLVTYEDERPETVSAGLYYLAAMQAGALCLATALAGTALRAGSADFADFGRAMGHGDAFTVTFFFLFLAGFGTKAGFVPLHTWLPRAHPAAPSHVSGMMSGIMIKTGIFGLLRVVLWMDRPPAALGYVVLAVGAVSALAGVAHAIAQHDLKRLLAYHSVENIGIIGLGLGAGMLGLAFDSPTLAALGFAGGLLHVLNHSLFKGLLFYGAGAVYRATHTRDLEKLGGLAKRMRVTGALFLVGCAAICGLPPFNGFVSEFLVYLGLLSGAARGPFTLSFALVLSTACLAMVGVMAVLCFTKVYGVVFQGMPRTPEADHAREVSLLMRVPMAVLAALCLGVGLFPQYALRAVEQPVRLLARLDPGAPLPGLKGMTTVSTVMLAFVGLAAAVLLLRALLVARGPHAEARTWDCGYRAGNPRMQYTASSFAGAFLDLARPFVRVRRHEKAPEGLFPKAARFETHPADTVEDLAVNPALRGIDRLAGAFAWIQSGSTQRYLLYGILFLIVALVATSGGRP
ncbi:MAG: oxidoreductase [Acidobacteria bacterium]|nr:oxidoreductase [Acidobacteriota bacterium]